MELNMFLIVALFFPTPRSSAFSACTCGNQASSRMGGSLKTATNPFDLANNSLVVPNGLLNLEGIDHDARNIHTSAAYTNISDLVYSNAENILSIDTGLVERDPPEQQHTHNELVDRILSSYIGPRAVLAAVAMLYATNFSLGAIMNDNLPASAATSSRMVLASLVLSPFLVQLKPSLRWQVLIGGSFVSLGYIAQSIALIDTSPALVSFLGSATVIVCPFLQWLIDKKPMGWKDAPQTWLAAGLCLSGVAALELFDSSVIDSSSLGLSRLGTGDILSLIQAVGFGTGMFMSEKMMKNEPDQALPITAGLVATTAFIAMIWSVLDGWMQEPGWQKLGLPGLFLDPDMRTVGLAVAWTGILSTSTNFFIEITALGRVPSAEASVILATEPLWASLFAAILFSEHFGVNDYIGGLLMISGCLVNTLKPSALKRFVGFGRNVTESGENFF